MRWLIFVLCLSCVELGFSEEFLRGIDLSQHNRMIACGATFKAMNKPIKVQQEFANRGANLLRIGLLYEPDEEHDNFTAAVKSLRLAKEQSMSTLLVFGYVEDFYLTRKAGLPLDWRGSADNIPHLTSLAVAYTKRIVEQLKQQQALPDMIQIGVQADAGFLANLSVAKQVNWENNHLFLRAIIEQLRIIVPEVSVVLHFRNTANIMLSMESLQAEDIDFDIISMSYYPSFDKFSIEQIADRARDLKENYHRPVLLGETAASWTASWKDQAINYLTDFTWLKQFGATTPTPALQLQFLTELASHLQDVDALGMIYWQPSWISTKCSSPINPTINGSHWENATFFDFDGNLIENGGVLFLKGQKNDVAPSSN